MTAPLRRLIWALAALLLLGFLLEGCRTIGDPDPRGDAATGARATEEHATTEALATEAGSLRSATGCRLDYTVYRRAEDRRPADVVLAHGFLRDRARMEGLARALAEAGMTTVAVDFCNMKPWDGAHRQNAEDLRAIAEQLARPAPVYAGFSAGALAAVLAARADPSARGVLALDLVDLDGMGEQAARALEPPIVGVFGEPSSCNAERNGLAVLAAAPEAELIRIGGATHCDFESPTDAFCRLVCEPRDRSADAVTRIRARIIDESVAAAGRLIAREAVAGD